MPAKKKPTTRGRPRLHPPDMDTTIQIRCTAEDREDWSELAAELGLQVGPWLRVLAMREKKKARS